MNEELAANLALSKKPRFQLSIRSTLIFFAAIAALLAMGIELNRRVDDFVLNPYRVQYAAELLIEHMDKTGEWPCSWADLTLIVESKRAEEREIQWYYDVRRNVQVDFLFDPHSVKLEDLQKEPPVQFVVAHDGTLHGATGDPNAMIARYLQQRREKKDTSR
jgi:hypothetical protein